MLVGAARSADSTAAYVFLDIAVIMVAARLAGGLMRRIGQPAVIGEIIVGLLLGKSLLGAFPGHLESHLFPTDVQPYLSALAQVGLVIFMFLVGLEIDTSMLRGRIRLTASVSLGSIALPFALGLAVAFHLYGSHDLVASLTHPGQIHQVKQLSFVLFLGASMSVTAFPVLARILAEEGLYRIPLGAITLACAAVADVAAWTLLAVVLAIVSSSHLLHLPAVLGETAAFFVVMIFVVRPLLARLIAYYRGRRDSMSELMVIVLTGILVCSWITSEIGIHQIFGAFLFGAIIPKEGTGQFVSDVVDRLESVAVLLLLPLFFVVTGFSVNVRAIGVSGLGQLGLILVAAIGGKLLGAALGARVNGLPGRRAATVGVLMNTRGLTELVILNVGYMAGVLDEKLFTLMVVMAVVTTLMTEPLLKLVYPDRLLAADLADAERLAEGRGGLRLLALVDDDPASEAVVAVASELAASDPGAMVSVSTFATRPSRRVAGMAGELGQMADLMDRLSALCQQYPEAPLRPAALFTDDVERELRGQVERLEIDAVVVSATSSSLVASLLRSPPCDVVVVCRALQDGPVFARTDDGNDGPAVMEMAARMAAGGRKLCLLGDGRGLHRRLAGAADRLRPALAGGVEVNPGDDASTREAGVVVAPSGMMAASLEIRSGEDRARVGWDERLARLQLPGTAATGVPS